MDRVQPQPDGRQQLMVARFQLKRVSCANGPLAVVMAQAAFFRFQAQRQHLVHPLIEPINGQAGAFLKHVRMLAEGVVSHDHAPQGTSLPTLLRKVNHLMRGDQSTDQGYRM
jgi:hypothetical protein